MQIYYAELFLIGSLLYFIFFREADENRDRENGAALFIQRVYRGTIAREKIAKKRYVRRIYYCFP